MNDNLLVNRVVLPGQRLCRSTEPYSSGQGSYEHQGYIYSSLGGRLAVKRLEPRLEAPEDRSTPRRNGSHVLEITVEREKRAVVPFVGSIVIARVTSINSRFAKCSIVSVDGASATDSFRALVRKEDVRATEKDKVEIHKCFQPTDLIVARVLSLGDAHAYLLSTAENELGVVVAYSPDGHVMVPYSWCEVQCPVSLMKQFRKVAKPQPRYLEIKN